MPTRFQATSFDEKSGIADGDAAGCAKAAAEMQKHSGGAVDNSA